MKQRKTSCRMPIPSKQTDAAGVHRLRAGSARKGSASRAIRGVLCGLVLVLHVWMPLSANAERSTVADSSEDAAVSAAVMNSAVAANATAAIDSATVANVATAVGSSLVGRSTTRTAASLRYSARPAWTAAFPALPNGAANVDGSRMTLTFGYPPSSTSLGVGGSQVSPVGVDGQALTLPVQWGANNVGTVSMLLDDPLSRFSYANGKLSLQVSALLPAAGSRIRIGEAVVALVRQPAYYERISYRVPTQVPGPETAYKVANGLLAPQDDLPVAGHILRVTLWLENRSGRMLSVALGGSPSTVSGNLVDTDVSEALRYVSSDTLLPDGYLPNLSWTRNLSCIRTGTAFAFHPQVLSNLRALLSDAAADGVSRYQLGNSYRSAVWQKQLFDRRYRLSVADPSISDPLAATLRRVTRPNGSEHQTAMAFDMFAINAREETFGLTPEYAWLERTGWKYGFAVRYPTGRESTTGVMFEPWHIRWFGRPVAAWLHREDKVYEELVAQVRRQGAMWLGTVESAGEPGDTVVPASAGMTTEVSSTTITGGTGYLSVDSMPGIIWLAVPATPEAGYASANSAYAPEISWFLPDQQLWLIPMGTASAVSRRP